MSVRYKKAPYGTLRLIEEYPRKEKLVNNQTSFEKVWLSHQSRVH